MKQLFIFIGYVVIALIGSWLGFQLALDPPKLQDASYSLPASTPYTLKLDNDSIYIMDGED